MTVSRYNGLHFNNGNFSTVKDTLAVEESLSVSINGEPFTVTMRTPGAETELVTGLLFTEEVYRDLNNFPVLEVTATSDKGFITSVNVKLPRENILKDFARTRNIISASSCGLCGRTSFEETLSKQKVDAAGIIDPQMVEAMFNSMSEHQDDFRQSGGTHASAAFTLDGKLLEIKEDIGRHNAVDKVIGGLILNHKLDEAACMTVSGRVSYEIINKAQSAGIAFLASVSAPSSMAVELATSAGITLMAFCRNKKLTVYSHPERVEQTTSVTAKH